METLLEIIMEIVMEGTLYTAGNKKVSLWIRIPLYLGYCCCFSGFIIAGSFLTGIIIVEERGVFQGSDHAWYLRSDAGSPDKTDC
mgnify:CR=1 FL=1